MRRCTHRLSRAQLDWRLSDDPVDENDADEWQDEEVRKNTKCTIFLSYTSNMISSGMREVLRFLVQHKMVRCSSTRPHERGAPSHCASPQVDCIVTTGGGIEEDLIKCLAPTYLGDFSLRGSELRKKGLNRIGNLLVPNDNYCKFEDWINPILDAMLKEQETEVRQGSIQPLLAPRAVANTTPPWGPFARSPQGKLWTPSKMIHRLGKEINNEDSVYYWAWKVGAALVTPAPPDRARGLTPPPPRSRRTTSQCTAPPSPTAPSGTCSSSTPTRASPWSSTLCKVGRSSPQPSALRPHPD